MYVSIRPEQVQEVNAQVRDLWIIETCKHTKERIEASLEAKKLAQKTSYDLKKLGFSKELSEGVLAAESHYSDTDLEKYISLIRESLQYLVPGKETLPGPFSKKEEKHKKQASSKQVKKQPEPVKEESNDVEEIENLVMDSIKSIEGEEGAAWDDIVQTCKKKGVDENAIEEALTSLMDKGVVYEPVLGTIKST